MSADIEKKWSKKCRLGQSAHWKPHGSGFDLMSRWRCRAPNSTAVNHILKVLIWLQELSKPLQEDHSTICVPSLNMSSDAVKWNYSAEHLERPKVRPLEYRHRMFFKVVFIWIYCIFFLLTTFGPEVVKIKALGMLFLPSSVSLRSACVLSLFQSRAWFPATDLRGGAWGGEI